MATTISATLHIGAVLTLLTLFSTFHIPETNLRKGQCFFIGYSVADEGKKGQQIRFQV